jgi:hypothetical protein
MIAGRAPAKSWAGDSNNFGESVRYIARSGALREGQEPALAVWSATVSSIETAPLEMERLAAQSRTKDPLYFFTASWSLGEQPTIEQARDAADTYTRKLGFEGLQVVWSLQNDGKAGLYHLHAVFNLVDPETKTARSTWREGQKCREASRQVEFEGGWERADNRTKRERPRKRANAGSVWPSYARSNGRRRSWRRSPRTKSPSRSPTRKRRSLNGSRTRRSTSRRSRRSWPVPCRCGTRRRARTASRRRPCCKHMGS